MLIFLKHFDRRPKGVQSFYVRGNQKMSSLVSKINDLMGWSQNDGVNLDEDKKIGFVLFKETHYPYAIDGNLTFAQHHISDGDVVWFWRSQAKER